MGKQELSEMSKSRELNGGKLRGNDYQPREELFLTGSSYASPILELFIRLTSVLLLLISLYDIIFMPWNTLESLILHYLPWFVIYLFYEIGIITGKKRNRVQIHFILTLAIILPLLHYVVISPESYRQIYLFEAVLLTGMYFIVPGKEISTALALSLVLSIFFIGLLLVKEIHFTSRWTLILLFYHLLILGGLMLTYLIKAMLSRIVRISGELSSQNSVYRSLKEEFCNTLDGLTIGILLINSEGKIQVYNERFEELIGKSGIKEAESIQELELGLQEPERGYIRDLLETEVEINEELQVDRGGERRWLRLKGLRIHPKEGDRQYLILLEDISEEKQIKLTRDRLERYLAAVFNPESSIVLYERGEGHVYFTENVKQLTGWSSSELKSGKAKFEDLVNTEDREFIRGKYRAWSKRGKRGILYLWYRLNHREGRQVWLEERMSCIRSQSGKEIITGILIDNTELKTTERDLRKSELGLRRAQELARIGSFEYLEKGEEINASAEFFKLLEMDEDAKNQLLDYEKYIREEDLEELHWKLKECREKGESQFSHECGIRTSSGNELIVAVEMEISWHAGSIERLEGTMMDITNRKRLEQQLFQNQKMEAIGTLAGGIAHDFNNILNIIMGYASVINEQLPNDSNLWQKFDRINAAASRAKNLVTHILTISRQHESRRQPIKLKELIKEHLELLRAAIPSVVEIRQELESEAFIYGDPDQIEQVIMNLCTNACYAMEPEGGHLDVRLHDAGDLVRIEVADTGSGIPSKVLEKMFDPYFTTKPKGEGTGLGLAIVKGIVEGLRGEITVNSEQGEGSKFTIRIPRFTKDNERLVVQEEVVKEEESLRSEIKVMFIDDEEALLELFADYLESKGLRVTSFGNGRSALEAMESNPGNWDILVSDISLPEMDGLEIVRRVRELDRDLPVILYSGFKRPSFMEQARILNVSKMLIKPVVPENMLNEIRTILEEK